MTGLKVDELITTSYKFLLNIFIQFKAIAGIKYSYCIELRPDGDDYSNGFVLPETEIPLAGEEMFVGIKTLINSFIDSRLYYNYF